MIPRGTAAVVGRRLTPEPERPLPTDPVRWVRETLDEFLWSKQVEIMRAVREHRKVAVQSCHQIGKSYIAARVAAWWIAAHPPGEARIVTTAPSGDQVKAILWREIQTAHARGRLPGRITRGQVPRWTLGDLEIGQGRKPAGYVDAERARTAFQGLHARYLLGVIEEGCGIPLWLWQAFDTLATNESSRLLAIGNPDDPTTEFAKVCAPGSGWHVISISAYDSPNFTGEAVPEQLRESLISPAWAEEQERRYGRDSAYVTSKVRGEWPEIADDVIISPKLVREAHERDLSGDAIGTHGQRGMDVARHGADETCIYENRGGMIRLVDAWRGLDTTESANRAELHADPHDLFTIDATGLGWGVYDPLRHKDLNVRAFQGGEAAHDPTRFVNLVTEAWWSFREGLEDGLIDLDADDEVLAAQLQSRKWRMDTAQKRIRMETKDEMAARGIESPDRADAAILSWFEGARVPDAAGLGVHDAPNPLTTQDAPPPHDLATVEW